MTFDKSVERGKFYFPRLQIKYKDESIFMKVLGKLLFFSSKFATTTTTIGSTIYFPSAQRVIDRPSPSVATLCHELSHMYSSEKKTRLLYSLYYLFPQILVFLSIPVFFFFSFFKSLLCFLFLLPLPSPTRTAEEKMGYTISIYAMNKINNMGIDELNLQTYKEAVITNFQGPMYYFMWWLPGIESYFDDIVNKIERGEQPVYDKDLYDMVDDVVKG